jgi:hypothetical protein
MNTAAWSVALDVAKKCLSRFVFFSEVKLLDARYGDICPFLGFYAA